LATGNYISLKSLGLSFAQLLSIDWAAHQAFRSEKHGPYQLYLDSNYYRSLQWRHEFDRDAQPVGPYNSPMSKCSSSYYCLNLSVVRENIATSST
jgi:hypothetical protein